MTISSITSSAVQAFQPPQQRREPPPMNSTAELLGMSAEELRGAQRDGATLSDLASQKGVSMDDLVKSVAADLKASKPEGAPELSDDQLTQMATNIATGKRPQGPPPGDRSQGNLSSLAAALGVDPNTMLDGDLQALLGRISQTGYGSTVKDSVSGGLTFDRYA